MGPEKVGPVSVVAEAPRAREELVLLRRPSKVPVTARPLKEPEERRRRLRKDAGEAGEGPAGVMVLIETRPADPRPLVIEVEVTARRPNSEGWAG